MKQRRQFLKRVGGVAALLALASPGKARMKITGEMEGSFVHVVFFWLIDHSQEVKQKFEHELRSFIDNVDFIRTRHIGTPAETDRDVIDNSWSYSLILSFESKKDHDLYQADELHKKFIENASALWKKVQVYDSIKL